MWFSWLIQPIKWLFEKNGAAGLGLLLAASPRTHCMPGTEWKQCLLALLPWTHDSMQAVWWVETWTESMKPEGADLLQIKNSSLSEAHMQVSNQQRVSHTCPPTSLGALLASYVYMHTGIMGLIKRSFYSGNWMVQTIQLWYYSGGITHLFYLYATNTKCSLTSMCVCVFVCWRVWQ